MKSLSRHLPNQRVVHRQVTGYLCLVLLSIGLVGCPGDSTGILTFADVIPDIQIQDGAQSSDGTPDTDAGLDSTADAAPDGDAEPDGVANLDSAETSDDLAEPTDTNTDTDASTDILPDALPDADDVSTDTVFDGQTDTDTDTEVAIDPATDDFEQGTTPSANGWTTEGEVSVVSEFGGETPPSGDQMLFISTPDSSGGGEAAAASKTLEASAGTNAITFQMKVISSEFTEFCGSPYQDSFSLAITVGETTYDVALTIDDFCDADDGSCGCAPQNKTCDLNCLSTAFCTQDPGTGTCTDSYTCPCGKFAHGLIESDAPVEGNTVSATPWIPVTFHIAPLPTPMPPEEPEALVPVTVSLGLGAAGDTIYQTVVLVDDIQLTTL